MGGFVFDSSRNPEPLLFPGGQEQVAIHHDLLVYLSKHEPHMIPDISFGHIKDKGKANGLAKFLVCAQAVWYGIQVITRLGQGLATTLLELNVFAHVFCALLTYIFWWNKPLDIEEPTLIYADASKAGSISAAFWSRARMGLRTPLVVRRGDRTSTKAMRDLRGRVIEVDQVKFSTQRAEYLRNSRDDGTSVASQPGRRYVSNQGYDSETTVLRLNIRRPLIENRFALEEFFKDFFEDFLDFFKNTSKGRSKVRFKDRVFIELNNALVKTELERSSICTSTEVFGPDDQVYVAFEDHHLQRHLCAYSHPAGLQILDLDSQELKLHQMRSHVPKWSGLGLDAEMVAQSGLFTVANMLYGACHLTAWNGPFRTTIEAILWKVSAVGVAFGALFIMAVSSLGHAESLVKKFRQKESATSKSLSSSIFYSFVWFLAILNMLAYYLMVFSRYYLVVESFISLAFASDAVFTVPQWSIYFPHIG